MKNDELHDLGMTEQSFHMVAKDLIEKLHEMPEYEFNQIIATYNTLGGVLEHAQWLRGMTYPVIGEV